MSTRKKAAVAFLELASAGEVDKAYGTYIAPKFTHHNPYFPSSTEALAKGMKENAEQYPFKIFEVLHAVEEDDLVAVHSRIRMNPDDSDIAVVHLFRFDGEQVVELWDIAQQVPEDSPNENGMF